MNTLIKEVHSLLRSSNLKISFAESCTGGLIQKLITDNAGSSDYFEGGLVVYSNRLKNELLGVSQEILAKFGAVSSECALAMVKGLSELTKADIAVSVTGIAGPDGGSPDKPVGTVWFAFKFAEKSFAQVKYFEGQREDIRHASALFVLDIIKEYLIRGYNENIGIR